MIPSNSPVSTFPKLNNTLQTKIIEFGTTLGMTVGEHAGAIPGVLLGGVLGQFWTKKGLDLYKVATYKPDDTSPAGKVSCPFKPKQEWGTWVCFANDNQALKGLLPLNSTDYRCLGQGTYGYLTACSDPDGNEYAVKMFPYSSDYGLTLEKGEINALLFNGHPNIVNTYCIIIHDTKNKNYCVINDASQIPSNQNDYRVVATVAECINGIDLSDNLRGIHKPDQLPVRGYDTGAQCASEVALKMSSALMFINQKNVLHRDLRPENIMINRETGVIKLIDFGFSKTFKDDERTYSLHGTIEYNAPESFCEENNRVHDRKVDAWSLGVLIIDIACNFLPSMYSPGGLTKTDSPLEEAKNIKLFGLLNDDEKKAYFNKYFNKAFKYDEPLLNVAIALTRYDPNERMSVPEAYERLKCYQQSSNELSLNNFLTGLGRLADRI